MATYVYDQQWQEERKRLAGMEALWDEGTRAVMDEIGVSPGWRCLEVGAGGGSMTEWLAERVGPAGSVLATDVYTKFLAVIERDNLEVREHDIVRGDPLPAEFDLVYARLVAEHLGRPAVERMAAAVKPGGVLLLEDYDWAAAGVHPPSERFERVLDGVIGFMSDAGYDPHFGRRLPEELEAVGLEGVRAEGRARVYRGGSPPSAFAKLSLMSLRGALVDAGRFDADELDTALAEIDDPANSYVSALIVACWGRRAA